MVVVTLQLIIPLYGLASEESAATYRVIVTVITYLPAVAIVIKRNAMSLIVPFAIYLFILIFHYVLYLESNKFIESRQAITLTPIAMLTAIFVCNIRDFGCFQRVLIILSRLVPVLGIIFVWGRQNLPHELTSSYSMSFGYSILLPSGYLFACGKWYDKGLSVILFLLILISGSRGPAIVLSLYYIIYLTLLSSNKKKFKTVLSLIIVGVVSVPMMLKYFDFSNSRTLNMISDDSALTHMSERDYIYRMAENAISDSPVLGHGIGADRSLWGGYCHNIFLELSLHYGIIISGILTMLFVYIILKYYFRPKCLLNSGNREFYVLMLLYGFVPMLVSGSYLLDFGFSFLIGYLFRIGVEIKESNRDNCRIMRSVR